MYTASVKGGFFSQYGATMTQIGARGDKAFAIAQTLNRKGSRAMRGALSALLGAAAGGAVNVTNKRVEANEELGGVRAIETETLRSAVTTADDVTDINAKLVEFTSRRYDNTPVANGDKNPLGTR